MPYLGNRLSFRSCDNTKLQTSVSKEKINFNYQLDNFVHLQVVVAFLQLFLISYLFLPPRSLYSSLVARLFGLEDSRNSKTTSNTQNYQKFPEKKTFKDKREKKTHTKNKKTRQKTFRKCLKENPTKRVFIAEEIIKRPGARKMPGAFLSLHLLINNTNLQPNETQTVLFCFLKES